MRAQLFLLLLPLLGCARTAKTDVIATHEREAAHSEATEVSECRIVGRGFLDASARLFADGDEPKALAHFNGSRVDVEVHRVPALLVDRVALRATTPSGFMLDGWVDRTALKFAARGRIPLAGDVAWIPGGTSLTVSVGEGKKVVVTPKTEHLASTSVLVPCEQVAIGPVEPERALEEVGEFYTLAADRLPVSPARGAPPTFTLRPRLGTSLTLRVEDVGDGMHLRFDDGISVDGWVDRAALKPLMTLSGFGCSSCGVSHGRRFALPPGAKLATARRVSRVGIGATGPGIVHGRVARGTEVIVLEELAGSARVLPRCREILPEPEQAFWVSRADLDVGIAISSLTSLDVGCR